jgi:hypothetical protein
MADSVRVYYEWMTESNIAKEAAKDPPKSKWGEFRDWSRRKQKAVDVIEKKDTSVK